MQGQQRPAKASGNSTPDLRCPSGASQVRGGQQVLISMHWSGLGGRAPRKRVSPWARQVFFSWDHPQRGMTAAGHQATLPASRRTRLHPREGVWVELLQFSSVQSLSHVRLFATPWITARQASLSITNSQSSLRLMSIELVMPSSHLILCRPLLLLPPIPPSIRVFSKKSTLRMRWPKYWSFSFSIIPSKEIPGLISFRMDWLDLLAVQGTLKRAS